MLEEWDPYHMWMAMYTRYVEPGDDFYFYCYDCVYYNNVGRSGLPSGQGYSVIVAWLNPFTDAGSTHPIVSLANSTITGENSTLVDNWTNDPSSSLAVATTVFNNYCVSGIHVQKRGVGENAFAPTMFNRFVEDA
jgi:hypothetical protein